MKFKLEDSAVIYRSKANTYVDYWRSICPTGVAVVKDNLCPSGGCLELFLNRADIFSVFEPDVGASCVQSNGASFATIFSPAPTWSFGCNEPYNFHLDKCFQRHSKLCHAVTN